MRYHGRDLRKGRTSIPGHVYFITSVTHDRTPAFTNPEAARALIAAMKFADEKSWCRTLAFVVMPDHLHWLLQLGERKSLPQLVGSVRQRAASNLAEQLNHPMWQRGFHDHAVRAEEDLRQLARYIVANPLRAGLVPDIGEYPWWDAVWVEDSVSPL